LSLEAALKSQYIQKKAPEALGEADRVREFVMFVVCSQDLQEAA